MARKRSRADLDRERRDRVDRLLNWREAFQVLNVGDVGAAYAPPPVNWYRPRPDPHPLPAPGFRLDDVLDDLVQGFNDPDGLGGMDLAVWRAGRLVAVVRRGADGSPEGTA